jgi:hypothetical protein
MNWHAPHLWEQIDQAFREAGPRKSPQEIVDVLRKRNPSAFARLVPQTLGRWIER